MSVKTFTALQMRQDLEGFLEYLLKHGEVALKHKKFPLINLKVNIEQNDVSAGSRFVKKAREIDKKNNYRPQAPELNYKNNRDMYDKLSKYQ